MSFSTAVVRDGVTFIFTNGQTEARNKVIRITTITKAGEGSVHSLKVGNNPVPQSDGPLAATLIDNGRNGIRLYVMNDGRIVEYGLDPEGDYRDAKWTKQMSFTDIKLDQNSYLTAFGWPQYGKGNDILLGLYFTQAGADRAVTLSQWSRAKNQWSPPAVVET